MVTSNSAHNGDNINKKIFFVPYASLNADNLDGNSDSNGYIGYNANVFVPKDCVFTETNINNKMYIKNMCYGNGKLVAIVARNSSSVKMKVMNAKDNPGSVTHWYDNLDEVNWSDCKLGATNFADSVSKLDDPNLNVLHYANGIFMLAHYNTGSEKTEIYTSEDGENWEKKNVLLQGKVHGLTYC